MVSVDAPCLMSIKGHSTLVCVLVVLVAGCGSFCDAREKKAAILSLKDAGLDGGGGGASGVAATVEAGADEAVDGGPIPTVLPVRPANSTSASIAAISAQSSRFVR